MSKKIFYIFPCYNESLNLNKILRDLNNFYKSKNISVKIIIVDDGSKDSSVKIINNFKHQNSQKNISIKILRQVSNIAS